MGENYIDRVYSMCVYARLVLTGNKSEKIHLQTCDITYLSTGDFAALPNVVGRVWLVGRFELVLRICG